MTALRRMPRLRRRGSTLIELLVGMVILGIIGGAMTKLLLVQGRFSSSAESYRVSRSVSRNAFNILMTDLRMVQDTLAIQAASPDSITIRVPYAYGVVCGTTSGITTVSLVPTDSAFYALATYGGYAYRDSASGVFQFTPRGSSAIGNGTASTCSDTVTGPGIDLVTYNGRPGQTKTISTSLAGSQPGNPMFLWQQITYRFGASTAYPGLRGLYRLIDNGTASPVTDEITAPFDTSAHFRFYVLNSETSQVTPPANLNTIKGFDLRLNARSPTIPEANSAPKLTQMTTAVYFKDRRDP